MSEIVLPEGGIKDLGGLFRAMRATMRGYWTQAASYQKFLYRLGVLLLASGVFHTGVLIVTGGSLAGPVSWRKPIIFGFSTGVTFISVAWVMTFLPKHRVRGWLLSGTLGIAFLVEVFLITMQQWRGVPSHFNMGTPFDAAVWSVMGFMILPVEIVVIISALWSFISLQAASPSFAWAIRTGMALLVASQIFGNLIIQNGISKVIDFQTGEFISEGIKSASIFGAAGSMKMPHALTLHAIQVLPVLAWLLRFTNWSESRRTQTVIVAAAGYTGLVAVSAFQTFSGLAAFDLNLPAAMVLGISVMGIGVAYAAALVALRQTFAPAASGRAAR